MIVLLYEYALERRNEKEQLLVRSSGRGLPVLLVGRSRVSIYAKNGPAVQVQYCTKSIFYYDPLL